MAINIITGTPEDDKLTGTGNADEINGLGGADRIDGKDGDDTLDGGKGDDELRGGLGEDWVLGGGGNDMLDGGFDEASIRPYSGPGRDDFLSGGAGNDVITAGWLGHDTIDAGSGDDLVTISDARRFTAASGGDGFDVLQLSAEKNEALRFDAGDKSDAIDGFEQYFLHGGRASDRVTMGTGDDEYRAWQGNDIAFGMGGNDLLNGGDGKDRLDGGNGQDRLNGREGLDHLTGGRGADWFQFGSLEDSADRITDFEAGRDHIRISSYLTGLTLTSGALDPALFHAGVAVGTEGQFVLVDDGDKDRLFWDANGVDAGGGTQLAVLLGDSGLTADDISIV